jgi:hypothetical protein
MPCRDVGVDAALLAVLWVGLAPVTRIVRHNHRQIISAGGDPFQHRLQVLNIRSLAAHAHSHDHLVVYRYLAVVALQVGTAGLHQMAVRVSEIALCLVVGALSAFWLRPRLGMASAASGSRSGGSKPASSAAAIAFSLAALVLAAAASAFLVSSACSAAGASASCAAVA